MVGLGLAWLARLPFSVAALWWDRRHGLSSAGYVDLVVDGWLGLAGTFVALSLALLAVMALARRLGAWWWLPGSLVLAAIAVTLVFVEPYLTTGLEPVGDPRIERAYERFRHAQGVGDVPLRVEEVSGDTSLANAYAFGLGPSRRVVLWDTLLDGRFTSREVDVVLAHELGHQSSDHIPKAIGWFALIMLPGALVLMLATRRRGGMGEPGGDPARAIGRRGHPGRRGAGREPRQPPDGGRGRLEGARDHPRPGRRRAASSASSRRPRSATRARRPGRSSSSARTRRSPVAWRWPMPGRRGATRSCQARCHVRFRRGVLRQVSDVAEYGFMRLWALRTIRSRPTTCQARSHVRTGHGRSGRG